MEYVILVLQTLPSFSWNQWCVSYISITHTPSHKVVCQMKFENRTFGFLLGYKDCYFYEMPRPWLPKHFSFYSCNVFKRFLTMLSTFGHASEYVNTKCALSVFFFSQQINPINFINLFELASH